MLVRNDTIAALSTPAGRGAIAIVRLSGSDAHPLAARLTTTFPTAARVVTLCMVHDERDGTLLDRALITRFDAPRSYTGEPMVEFACHGGMAASAAILEALIHIGARQADAGEFTQRAVLHGKMDLLQAEAVADLVDARTHALRKVALRQLDGSLSRALHELRDRAIHIEALLAYDIDFPEEDDGPVARTVIAAAAREAREQVDALLATVPLGEVARDGAVVVIAGPPNAGKSSLFNALLGQSRAIVTEIPGTTRDAIEARVEADGWPLRLIDTAGLRDTSDVVERLGIEVSERYVDDAHVLLVCAESFAELRSAVLRVEGRGAAVRIGVHTKRDVVSQDADTDHAGDTEDIAGVTTVVPVSVVTRRGLDELLKQIALVLAARVGELDVDLPMVTRARQRSALEQARAELDQFLTAWEGGLLPASVAAIHVRSATHALDELIGSVDVEDVLERVFRTFCVGK
ncbi:MAG: tRNA uridine-5-carboxymethylaminomethyl(34) synthesis GTPase MnmE [Gemmatimonadaceae bacterium]